MTVVDSARREQILASAARVFETSGIRASLREIAAACGILPGSLYHHFDSKEALVVELVTRYQTELDAIADAAIDEEGADAASLEPIVSLGTAIAECAVRHRAALLLTFYEPPSVAGIELAAVAAHTPGRAVAAMHELLVRARRRGLLRKTIDLAVLADRLCQSMLHIGIGVYHRKRGADRVPALKCRMLLQGLAAACPTDRDLDRSSARRAADEVIARWRQTEHTASQTEFIRTVARAEFGRRGYSATTIRDVAAAAGVQPGNLYRVVSSKEELLAMVLGAYVESVTTGWDAVMRADASPLEKLDALLWVDINALDQFSEEHKIQSASMQYAPPSTPDLGLSFPTQLRQVRQLLSEGERAGEVTLTDPSAEMRARCAFSLIWTPENIVRDLGIKQAQRFARETFLRGAATVRPPAVGDGSDRDGRASSH